MPARVVRPALLALAALTALPVALAAQAGRWRVLLTGGVPPQVRGELRLEHEAGAWRGTLLLETADTAPVPLGELAVAGGRIRFTAPGDPTLRFDGLFRNDVIRGQAAGGAGGEQRWTAERLPADARYYVSLPRFRMRQVAAGFFRDTTVIPGRWLARAGADPSETARYRALAAAAGFDPLAGPDGLAGFMTGEGRVALAAAGRRTLEAIRGSLDPPTRARFDAAFRPRGAWRTDLPSVALELARLRAGRIGWRDAAGALRGIGWLSPADTGPGDGTIPLALYRLWQVVHADTLARAELSAAMRQADPVSAVAAEALLAGYGQAVDWYGDALGFLVREAWVATAGGPRSLGALIADFWGLDSVPVPETRTHAFGYPQAVPRYGVPAALFDSLIEPENWTAAQWLRQHRPADLLRLLHRLPPDSAVSVGLEIGRGFFRVTTVAGEAARSLNGFLEPADAIMVEPGYPPLLAVATIVHEWQHLVYHHARARTPAPPPAGLAPGTVALRAQDPFLAEGLAEWGTARILAPVAERHPLVAVQEEAKRARMAERASDDPHLVGYRMIAALAEVVPAPGELLALVAAANDPAAVAADPRVRAAWKGPGSGPDRRVPLLDAPVLVPELRFTVEQNYPDLVGTTIRVGRR